MNERSSYRDRYESLLITPARAAIQIQSGDVVVVSGAASQPFAFLEALGKRRDLHRVTVYTTMTLIPPHFLVRQYVAANRGELPDRGIRFCSMCVGPGAREGAEAGVVDVIPASSGEVGRLLQQRRIDVVVVGSSGMDEDGNFNLACNVDWMPDILAAADQSDTLVIAEVNPLLPWAEGEATFRIESVDHVIESERPPVDLPSGQTLPEAQSVGGFLASMVPDEATLHLGIGDLVSQAAAFLDGKTDLGVHSDLICDVFHYLYERGALTCRKKGFMDGRWVGSFVLGSRLLYEFVHKNEMISLHPTDFVVQPPTIMRNRRMVSITEATQVDLYGQVAGQTLKFEFLTNGGVQHTFHKVAGASEGGMGIVVLPSTTRSGRASNIVPSVSGGSSVAIPAADVDCIVTEQGVARLRGRSVSERVLNLIAVAHPAQRDKLAFEAQKLGLL